MFKSTMKLFTLAIVAGFLMTAINTQAQTKQAPRQELKQLLHDFQINTVVPVLSKWKGMLDKSMSSEDLAKLNDLRTKATAIHEKAREQFKGNPPEGRGKGKENPAGKGMGPKGPMQEEMKALMEELKPLANKYKTTLEVISKLAVDKKVEWKGDITEIIGDWKEKNADLLNEHKGKGPDPMQALMGGPLQHLTPEMKNKITVARFMLWDGSTKFAEERMEEKKYQGSAQANTKVQASVNLQANTKVQGAVVKGISVNNSPNPFSDKTTITFNLSMAENVKLVVLDGQSKEIAVLINAKLPAGEQSVIFKTADYPNLSNGVYIYKLVTDSFSVNGKMILSR